MKHLFIPYYLVLLTKEKGFKEDCFGCYASYYETDKPDLYIEFKEEFNDFDIFMDAPIYQQIVDWLMNDHKIMIGLNYYNNSHGEWWEYRLGYLNKNGVGNTYYEALRKAVEEALKII